VRSAKRFFGIFRKRTRRFKVFDVEDFSKKKKIRVTGFRYDQKGWIAPQKCQFDIPSFIYLQQ